MFNSRRDKITYQVSLKEKSSREVIAILLAVGFVSPRGVSIWLFAPGKTMFEFITNIKAPDSHAYCIIQCLLKSVLAGTTALNFQRRYKPRVQKSYRAAKHLNRNVVDTVATAIDTADIVIPFFHLLCPCHPIP